MIGCGAGDKPDDYELADDMEDEEAAASLSGGEEAATAVAGSEDAEEAVEAAADGSSAPEEAAQAADVMDVESEAKTGEGEATAGAVPAGAQAGHADEAEETDEGEGDEEEAMAKLLQETAMEVRETGTDLLAMVVTKEKIEIDEDTAMEAVARAVEAAGVDPDEQEERVDLFTVWDGMDQQQVVRQDWTRLRCAL